VTCKSYDIPKTLVWEAWLRVKANHGSAGIDAETIERFETKLGEHARSWGVSRRELRNVIVMAHPESWVAPLE
jgi:hypothetical protein